MEVGREVAKILEQCTRVMLAMKNGPTSKIALPTTATQFLLSQNLLTVS
jgi:hypothetical protein